MSLDLNSIFSRLATDIRKPFNALSLFVGVIGILLAIWSIRTGRTVPDPSFFVSNVIGEVFNSSISSPRLRVIDEDNNTIDEDIFLASITFWNDGNEPIDGDDIIESIYLRTDSIDKLLDYTIVHQSDPAINRFSLVVIQELSGDRNILLDWNYLAPGQGAEIQLIYTSKDDSGNLDIEITGFIRGSGRSFARKIPTERLAFVEIVAGFLIIPLFYLQFFEWSSKIKNRRNRNITRGVFIIILLTYTIFLTSSVAHSWITEVPRRFPDF